MSIAKYVVDSDNGVVDGIHPGVSIQRLTGISVNMAYEHSSRHAIEKKSIDQALFDTQVHTVAKEKL